jgi:hypothetical protein
MRNEMKKIAELLSIDHETYDNKAQRIAMRVTVSTFLVALILTAVSLTQAMTV